MYLSVIIPYFNEKNHIIDNLIEINNYFRNKFEFEIIIIDDSGKNNFKSNLSKNLLENFSNNLIIIENIKNYGKGYSIKEGVKKSKGKIILFTDADLSTPIKEFEKLYAFYKDDYKIVIGSRNQLNSIIKKEKTLLRKILGRLFNIYIRVILKLNYKDTQCGFKLFDSLSIKKIIDKSFVERFCIDPEILYIASKANLKIKEVGIEWSDDWNSSLKLRKDIINMFLDVIKIRLKH